MTGIECRHRRSRLDKARFWHQTRQIQKTPSSAIKKRRVGQSLEVLVSHRQSTLQTVYTQVIVCRYNRNDARKALQRLLQRLEERNLIWRETFKSVGSISDASPKT